VAYSATFEVFELNSACNSYKKSGKIGEELNSWINPVSPLRQGFSETSLCNSTSGVHFIKKLEFKLYFFKLGWWNGRHEGLKSPYPQGCEGSTPSLSTSAQQISECTMFIF
jgi:hypothetical protein